MKTRVTNVLGLVTFFLCFLFVSNSYAVVAEPNWQDVSNVVTVDQSTGNYDRRQRVYFSSLQVTNTSGDAIGGAIRAVITESNKTPQNPDGTSADGFPFFYLTENSDTVVLQNGEATVPLRINFSGGRGALVYSVRIENNPPSIDSDNDGVPDSEDVCPGFDDAIDGDSDGIPDGCDDDLDNDGVNNTADACPGTALSAVVGPDGCSEEQFSALVFGTVTDTNGNPVAGAVVKLGTATVFVETDADGKYSAQITAAEVSDSGLVFASTAPEGYTSFQTKVNVNLLNNQSPYSADLTIKEVTVQEVISSPDTTPISVAAVEEGEEEAILNIPAGSVVDESGNTVTEDVTVELTTIDPGSEEITAFTGSDFIAAVAPGEGIDGGDEATLESVVLAEVTITGNDSGNEYEDLNAGATLELRLPDSEQGKYPAGTKIPLWFYDEETGKWHQEGEGEVFSKELGAGTGIFEDWVTAIVNHFTWWNIDWPVTSHTCYAGRLLRKDTGQPITNINLQAEGVTYNGTSYGENDGNGNVCVSVKRSETNTEQVVFFLQIDGQRQYLRKVGAEFVLTTVKADATVYDNPTFQASCRIDKSQCSDLGDIIVDMNRGPVINLNPTRSSVRAGDSTTILATVVDPDGDAFSCTWTGAGLSNTSDTGATWTAPALFGTYPVTMSCTDVYGASNSQTVNMLSVENNPPVIINVVVNPFQVPSSGTSDWDAVCSDPDGDNISQFEWQTLYGGGGTIASATTTTGANSWTAPGTAGARYHQVRCTDENGATGDWYTFTNYVVNLSPTVALVANPDPVGVNDTTIITATATDPEGNTPLTYSWYAPSGTIISGADTNQIVYDPLHASGSAWVRVTVRDSFGQATTRYIYISVDNQPPVIDSITCTGGNGPGDVKNCTATATDPNGDLVNQFAWSSYHGGTTGSNTDTEMWTLPSSGTAYLYARAQDEHGAWGNWKWIWVTVENSPPSVTAINCTGALRPYSALDCIAIASDPDADDSVTEYQWSRWRGSLSGDTSSDNVTWTLPFSGSAWIYARAKDNHGAWGSWFNMMVTIVNSAPTVSNLTATPDAINAGEVSRLRVDIADINGDSLLCQWTPDGGVISDEVVGADFCEADWMAPTGSIHSPCVRAIEDFGGGLTGLSSPELCVDIDVNNGPDITLVADPTSVDEGGVSTITATVFDPESDAIDSFAWSTSCGTLSNTSLSGATFTAPTDFSGRCIVTLTATDDKGAVGSQTASILVSGEFIPDQNLDVSVVDQLGNPREGVFVWLDDGTSNPIYLTTDANGLASFGDQGSTDPVTLTIAGENQWGERHIVTYKGIQPGTLILVLPDTSVCSSLTCGSLVANFDIQLGNTDGVWSWFEPRLYYSLEGTSQSTGFFNDVELYSSKLQSDDLFSLIGRSADRYGFVVDQDPALVDGGVLNFDLDQTREMITVNWENIFDDTWNSIVANRGGQEFDIQRQWGGGTTILGMRQFPADYFLHTAQSFEYSGDGLNSFGRLFVEVLTLNTLPEAIDVSFLDVNTPVADIAMGNSASIEFDLIDDGDASDVDLYKVDFRGYSQDFNTVLWTVIGFTDTGLSADFNLATPELPDVIEEWTIAQPFGECGFFGEGGTAGDANLWAIAFEPGNGVQDFFNAVQTARLQANFDPVTPIYFWTDLAWDEQGFGLPNLQWIRGTATSACDIGSFSLSGTVYDFDASSGLFNPFPNCSVYMDNFFTIETLSCDSLGQFGPVDVIGSTYWAFAWEDDISFNTLAYRADRDIPEDTVVERSIFGGIDDVPTDFDEPFTLNNDTSGASMLASPAQAGFLSTLEDVDHFRIDLTEGEQVHVVVHGDPWNYSNHGQYEFVDALGNPVSETVSFNPWGDSWNWSDELGGAIQGIVFTAPSTGPWYLRVRSASDAGPYVVEQVTTYAGFGGPQGGSVFLD